MCRDPSRRIVDAGRDLSEGAPPGLKPRFGPIDAPGLLRGRL